MALKTAAKAITKALPQTKSAKKATGSKPAQAVNVVDSATAKALIVTTKHLAAVIAEQHGMPQKQAGLLLTGLVDLMIGHLKKGDRLRIGGLGTLEIKARAARQGRNPATGAVIQIKASRKIAFRPAKELKEAL